MCSEMYLTINDRNKINHLIEQLIWPLKSLKLYVNCVNCIMSGLWM